MGQKIGDAENSRKNTGITSPPSSTDASQPREIGVVVPNPKVTNGRPGRTSRTILKMRKFTKVGCGVEERIVVMKVSTATVIGVLAGFAIGIIGLGRANSVSLDLANLAPQIHQHLLWIVLLSLLVPLADYFVSTNLPTTVIGYVARQPFRHVAGFFTGLAVGLLALTLIAPQMLV